MKKIANYRAYKNLKIFHEAGGYDEGYHDIDYFYYEVESREKYQVGDDISIKNKHLYVNQYSTYAIKDEVIYKYRLCRKNGVWQTKLYNSLIGGASLEGNVLAVDGEKVKLHLNIDKTQNEAEASWFPYAPPTGNVLYSMPIVGTIARLYFPSETSEDPIITGCVRTNGSSCAKTSDTTNRYFGTEHGSEIEMTPGAVKIKGGSKEPLSISFDDNIGVTLTSPKNLNLNADDDIIIKTPQSVKVKAQSQIGVIKAGTENGFSVETDMHFKGGSVINDGSNREAFAPFDDEPKAGKKPEPPAPPKEEKKGFNWGGLLVAAIAVVAVVATFGVGAVLVGAAIGACVGAACAVASTAISDKINGTHSSLGTYAQNALKGAFTGAVSGAIFGPFGSFSSVGGVMAFGAVNGMADSVINQAIDGEFSLQQTLLDGLIGAATGGLLHGAGKIISKVSPFVTKSVGKVLGKLSGEAEEILSKVSGKADDILGAFSKTSRELFDTVASKANNVVNSIKESAEKLVDRVSNKFNEVTTSFDNKVDDLLRAGASKLDDGVNVLNQARYNVRQALGLEKELVPTGGVRMNNAPDETSFFKNQISKITGNGSTNKVIASEILNMKPKDVPSIRNGEFNKWFNELSDEDLNEIFTNPKLQNVKDRVKDRIRHPGELHEWLMCEKAPKFKSWGITMEKIKELRTSTQDTNFLNPTGTHHCSSGGKKAHNELAKLIDKSSSFEEFRIKLSKWADKKVEGGRDALPEGLRVSE